MRFSDVLRRSDVSPNVDLDCFTAAEDLSGIPATATRLDVSEGMKIDDPEIGFTLGEQPPLFLGFVQNAPKHGVECITRIAGFATVVYAATVAVGDLLTFATGADKGKMVPWIPGTNGHTHKETISDIVHVVFVADDKGNGVAGIDPGDFTISVDVDNETSMIAFGGGIDIADFGSGEYRIRFTPAKSAAMHRTLVGAVIHGTTDPLLVTPQVFQDISTSVPSVPDGASLGHITGQAITAGNAGDTGIVFMRPQII